MKYSEYMKQSKENNIKRFFGDVSKKTNKYFTFNHVIDNDNIIIITGNVKIVKGSYVLVIGSNKAVFLKPWQVKEVHNYYSGYSGYAVKLNRNYFKPYTFKTGFDDFAFDDEDTFDTLKADAESQNSEQIALGA